MIDFLMGTGNQISFALAARYVLGPTLGLLFWGNATAQIPPSSSGKSLAPDALLVIPPAMESGETFLGPIDLPLVIQSPELKWEPNEAPVSETLVERASGVMLNVPIHCLEFAFKPVRTIEVNLPTSEGVKKSLVWYLVYRVRYSGDDLRPAVEKGGDGDQYSTDLYGTPEPVSVTWVRFMPTLTLRTKGKVQQTFLDEIIPEALVAIEAQEQIGQTLHDSISIQREKIALSAPYADQSTWGVAMWTGVSPETDFLSIEVQGLTNAQKVIQDGLEFYYPQKTLVLNFFRPGDAIEVAQDRIRFGIPAVNRIDGLKEEFNKAVAGNEYELTIVSGLSPRTDLSQSIREIAQTISGLGATQIRPFVKSGSILFSLQDPEQQPIIEQEVLRRLGLQVRVNPRTLPLSNAIREMSKPYSLSFREKLVERVAQGSSIRDVSVEHGCSMQTLVAWIEEALPRLQQELDSVDGPSVFELTVVADQRPVDPAALLSELNAVLVRLEVPQQVVPVGGGRYRFSLDSARLGTYIENVIQERLGVQAQILPLQQNLSQRVSQLEKSLADWKSEMNLKSRMQEQLANGDSLSAIAEKLGVPERTIAAWIAQSKSGGPVLEQLPSSPGDPNISIEQDLQDYVLEQFGVRDRVDYFWTYR
jgi:transposase-like protein